LAIGTQPQRRVEMAEADIPFAVVADIISHASKIFL